MTWHIQVEVRGDITDDQAETLLTETPADSTAVLPRAGITKIWARCETDTIGATELVRPIVAKFNEWGIPVLRVLIDTADLRLAGLPIIGTAEIAVRLGVSDERVRQLRREPGFPEPALGLTGGEMFWIADIDAYKERRRGPGRPRTSA